MIANRIFTLGALVLVSTATAQAATTARVTPAQAATRLKATYTTVDAKAYAAVKEHIAEELDAGRLPSDPVIVELEGDLRQTLHAARVTSARCVGVGKKARRYTRFHCTAKVMGAERTPPDRMFYTATLKLTVNVRHGFGVKTDWR